MARAILVAALLALAATCALAAADRTLLQSGVTCSKDIPACTERRCTLRTINDKDTYVCLRCMQGFVSAKQGANILQCVCPPGTYMTGSGKTRACTPCAQGSYCPGGNPKAVLATDNIGGNSVSCNPGSFSGLTTLASRSSKATDCVAQGGYVLPTIKGQPAQPCNGSSYAPNNNRLKSCLQCQTGLAAPPSLTGPRVLKAEVCQVPPGSFWEGTVARECPQGLYRESYLKTDQKAAAKCKNCPGGWTTQSKATTLLSGCSVLQPGFKLVGYAAGSTLPAGTVVLDAAFNPPATELCPVGYYYDGSAGVYTCTKCPYDVPTLANGSTSVDDCVVPPGYYINTNTNLVTKCPTSNGDSSVAGYYRTGWVSYNLVLDTDGKSKCSACGAGIPSEAVEDDENPLAAADSVVAATSAACYIPAGWGMTFDPTDFTKFKAAICPASTYGVAKTTYGLFNSPCKTCAKGLYSAAGSIAITDCKNLGGFGYSTEGSSQCPDDMYAIQDSMAPCSKCPAGRVTNYVPGVGTWQDAATDCKVPAGFGVYSASAADPFNPPSPTEALTAKACPVGFYAAGEDLTAAGPTANPTCQACAGLSSTAGPGAATCDVCAAGAGINGGASCTTCTYGFYSPGSVADCTQCPSTTFQSDFGDVYTSSGLTVKTGLTGAESCVPQYSQLSADAGTRLGLPDVMFTDVTLTSADDASFVSDCVAACPTGKVCVAEAAKDQDTGVRTCKQAAFSPIAASVATKAKLYAKLPPSDTSAASVDTGVKSVASGVFAIADVDSFAANVANGTVGTSPDPSQVEVANSIAWGECANEAACRTACVADAACWGFLFHPDPTGAGPQFALRTGESAIGTRTFVGIPNGGDVTGTPLSSMGW